MGRWGDAEKDRWGDEGIRRWGDTEKRNEEFGR